MYGYDMAAFSDMPGTVSTSANRSTERWLEHRLAVQQSETTADLVRAFDELATALDDLEFRTFVGREAVEATVEEARRNVGADFYGAAERAAQRVQAKFETSEIRMSVKPSAPPAPPAAIVLPPPPPPPPA
jgi:hypothetical protein